MTTIKTAPRFKLGDRYIPTGKKYVCTITDILSTFNLAGDLVKVEYQASYQFVNTDAIRYDIETTVARGLTTK